MPRIRLARNDTAVAARLNFGGTIKKMARHQLPDLKLGKRALNIFEDLVWDMMHRVCDQASTVAKFSKQHSIGQKEIETAVKLQFPLKLSKKITEFAGESYEQEYVYPCT